MKRALFLLAASVLINFGSHRLQAQDAKLEIKGEGVKIVEVDRQITVRVKVTVIDSPTVAKPIVIEAPPGAAGYTWTVPTGIVAVDKDDTLLITSAPRGEATVGVKILNLEWKPGQTTPPKFTRQFGSITFAVGDPGPGPTPPGPIGVPLGVPGFAVLVVYDKDNVPPGQQAIIFGQAVRNYLIMKCGTDSKNNKNFRIYPAGVDASGEVQWIRDAIQRHPGSKSWMVVSDGKGAYDGPIPATVDAAMAIFKQYAEPPMRTLYNFPVQLPGEVVPFMPTRESAISTTCGCTLGGVCFCGPLCQCK